MNTPIDPREGDRRQKALRARLSAMAEKNKALIGKLGQNRGQVRSVGAIGGARGARIPQNGSARPGGLNFLQPRGFGLGNGGAAPAMNPVFGGGMNRHVSNPLPSQSLEAPLPEPPPWQGPGQGTNSMLPPDRQLEGLGPDDPVISSFFDQPQTIQATPYNPATETYGASLSAGGLIPLGGGRYFNPATGTIHGGGGPMPRSYQAL